MGRDRVLKLADGVYARHYPSGRRAIQLQFFYRGARNRETLKNLDPEVKAHVNMARHRYGAIQDAIAKGTFDYAEFFPESKRAYLFGGKARKTVREYGKAWLADMETSKQPSTYRRYAGAMKSFVYPALGSKPMLAVTPDDIRELFRGADISLKTARNYSIPLKGIFTRAFDDGDIPRNPMDRVTLRDLISADKHVSTYEVDPLAKNEIDAFLRSCEAWRPEWLNYWTVAFFTGLRTSELYGLEWGDWRASQLDIQRAVVEGKVKLPKTQSSLRTIEIYGVVVQALKRQRKLTAFNDRIFWNPNTKDELVDYEVSQRCFNYVCKKAGIRHRNQYQTRHTYAANMLEAGESDRFVARQMGHKNTNMVHRVYGAWIRDNVTYTPRSDFGSA